MSQLRDLVASFSDMDATEQLEKIRAIREQRNVARPAAVARQRKAAKKKQPQLEKLMSEVSPEDLVKMLKELS